jgi:hypothetical protein
MKKGLLALLVLGAAFSGACVVLPPDPWEGPFAGFPFPWIFPFWALGLALYLLPTIVVIARRKKRILGPVLVNVLLGWTFIGWVVALIWACLVED